MIARPPAIGCRNADNPAVSVAYGLSPTGPGSARREAGARSSFLSTNPSPNPCWTALRMSAWRDRDTGMKVLWPGAAAAQSSRARQAALNKSTIGCRSARNWSGPTARNPRLSDLSRASTGSCSAASPALEKTRSSSPSNKPIGPWNFADVSPKQVLGRFNGFLRSVILRVNEARDLGEFDRYAFRDHMKAYIAAPPDVVRVDEKNLREYYVFNLCGVVITSNHKADGIYLPADDRRHMVAWSNLTKDDFADNYWRDLYGWYINGGNEQSPPISPALTYPASIRRRRHRRHRPFGRSPMPTARPKTLSSLTSSTTGRHHARPSGESSDRTAAGLRRMAAGSQEPTQHSASFRGLRIRRRLQPK